MTWIFYLYDFWVPSLNLNLVWCGGKFGYAQNKQHCNKLHSTLHCNVETIKYNGIPPGLEQNMKHKQHKVYTELLIIIIKIMIIIISQ